MIAGLLPHSRRPAARCSSRQGDHRPRADRGMVFRTTRLRQPLRPRKRRVRPRGRGVPKEERLDSRTALDARSGCRSRTTATSSASALGRHAPGVAIARTLTSSTHHPLDEPFGALDRRRGPGCRTNLEAVARAVTHDLFITQSIEEAGTSAITSCCSRTPGTVLKRSASRHGPPRSRCSATRSLDVVMGSRDDDRLDPEPAGE